MTPPEQPTLLGSPTGDSIDDSISTKISTLWVMEDKFQCLQLDDVLLLLHHSLAISRLVHLLQTAPCFLSSQVLVFDEILRRMLSHVTSISFFFEENIRLQASFLV